MARDSLFDWIDRTVLSPMPESSSRHTEQVPARRSGRRVSNTERFWCWKENRRSPLRSDSARSESRTVIVRSIEDEHAPKLHIVWEKPLDLAVFEMPPEARLFARERWQHAPLMAGFRRGCGRRVVDRGASRRSRIRTVPLHRTSPRRPRSGAAISIEPAVGVLRFVVSRARRSRLFCGALASSGNLGAARRGLALLGARSAGGRVSPPSD